MTSLFQPPATTEERTESVIGALKVCTTFCKKKLTYPEVTRVELHDMIKFNDCNPIYVPVTWQYNINLHKIIDDFVAEHNESIMLTSWGLDDALKLEERVTKLEGMVAELVAARKSN